MEVLSLSTKNRIEVSLATHGVQQTPLLEIAPGIGVLTGRNNVGKSRILQHVFQLRQAWGTSITPFDANIHVLKADGSEISLQWQPGNLAEYARYRIINSDKQLTVDAVTERRQGNDYWVRDMVANRGGAARFNQFPPSLSLLARNNLDIANALNAIVLVDPQRIVSAAVQTIPIDVPNPNGDNLGQALYKHRNNSSPQFDELQRVMAEIFPEVSQVLTLPTTANVVTVTILDRYSNERIPLDKCGTGVAQILHLVALILFSPPDRIFLIDEPHVYLHAQAEQALAKFFRQHAEHSYVVATHSPVLIDALEPDRIWLVTRDSNGTGIQPVYKDLQSRNAIFSALGWRPSQFAWADRVLFVEGESDTDVYREWFQRWEWSHEISRCGIVQLGGYGTAKPLQMVVKELESMLSVHMLFYLDGDKKDSITNPHVKFLPDTEMENILMRDIKAIRQVLLVENALISPQEREILLGKWTESAIEDFFRNHDSPKGSKRLTDLGHALGIRYEKTVHNLLVAKIMDLSYIQDIQEALKSFVLGTPKEGG